MIRIAHIPIILIAFLDLSYAGEVMWVNARGEAVVGERSTLLASRQQAVEYARRTAIEEAAGISIVGVTDMAAHIVLSDFVTSIAYGHIIEERIVRWDARILQSATQVFPTVVLSVELRAKVSLEQGRADPGFRLRASLNRKVFEEGDDVILKVMATKDCYLTVFVVTADDRAFLIYPLGDAFSVKAGKEIRIPSKGDAAKGIALTAGLLPGENETREYLKIIATKQPVPFTASQFTRGVGIEAYRRDSGLIPHLYRELVRIPTDERTEATIAYDIKR